MTIAEVKKIIKERTHIKNISTSKDKFVFLHFSATGENLDYHLNIISKLFEIEKDIYLNTFFNIESTRYKVLKIK